MSKRRQPGEIVRRIPGSGFVGSDEPKYVQVPEGAAYGFYDAPGSEGQADPCMMGCGDDECREWANLKIVGGPHDGEVMCHISECQMQDATSGEVLNG